MNSMTRCAKKSENVLAQSRQIRAELSDMELEAVVAAGKRGGGVGGRYSGLGVRPGYGVGAPGFGWRRGIG
jgi:hypothetical protein